MSLRRLTSDFRQWQTLAQLQQLKVDTELEKLDAISSALQDIQERKVLLQQQWDHAISLQDLNFALRQSLMDFLTFQNLQMDQYEVSIDGLQKQHQHQMSEVQKQVMAEDLLQRRSRMFAQKIADKSLEVMELQVSELAGVYYANQG